ncbi:MAG: class I SAM-dependent methyltransferase, partial [Candidatus Korobacteraceae bacterium]
MNALQKPDYGIDAPKVLRNLLLFGVLGLVLGIFGPRLVQLGPVRLLPRPMFFGTGSLLLLEGFLYLFYVKVGKLYHRDRILSLHSWRGDENVLDVGCGRGLLLVGAAKRMAQLSGNGTVTGVDIWSREDMSGNSEQATRRNLELEGVSDRCKLIGVAAQDLPFEDGTFD